MIARSRVMTVGLLGCAVLLLASGLCRAQLFLLPFQTSRPAEPPPPPELQTPPPGVISGTFTRTGGVTETGNTRVMTMGTLDRTSIEPYGGLVPSPSGATPQAVTGSGTPPGPPPSGAWETGNPSVTTAGLTPGERPAAEATGPSGRPGLPDGVSRISATRGFSDEPGSLRMHVGSGLIREGR